MISFKKAFISFGTVLLLLGTLCSCHGKLAPVEDATETASKEVVGELYKDNYVLPEKFDTSKQYEITFWAKNDTNITQKEIYEKAISDFQKIYPNVTVRFKLYTDYSRIYSDVITNISTNTTPNVCITYPDHIATYLSGEDTVVKLNNLMKDPEYGLGGSEVRFDSPTVEEIVPEFLEECAFGNSYFALPYMRSSEALYINKTLLEKLGYTLPENITWDFIWEVSEAAMKKNDDGTFALNGQKVLIPFIYKSTDNMMIQMLKQKNAPYSADNGEIYIFNNDTTRILEAIATHAKTRSFSTFKISSYPGNYLNANQCIFAIDSTAGATWMGSDAPLTDLHDNMIADFDIEIRMIPQFDYENKKMISQGPSVCIFNKEDSGEVLASWLFVQYLLTNDIQIAYSQTEGYVPVTLKAQNSKAYKDYLSREGEDNQLYYDIKIKASKLVLDNIENTFVTPVFNGSASLRSAAGQMIEEVVKSVRRKETVDSAYYEKLYSEMVSLFQLENISIPPEESSENVVTVTVTAEKENSFANLPAYSKALLIILAGIWVILGGYAITTNIKAKRK